ncbi:MAG: hypothetical protein KAU50_04200, partial [Candidatus Marinimicrobia bacterium]|nr:hypothetical protein [Candidatus Neomarinimicrobiota bacterium]
RRFLEAWMGFFVEHCGDPGAPPARHQRQGDSDVRPGRFRVAHMVRLEARDGELQSSTHLVGRFSGV